MGGWVGGGRNGGGGRVEDLVNPPTAVGELYAQRLDYDTRTACESQGPG